MRYHSNRKVKPMKKMLINMLHTLGVKPKKLVNIFSLSRATIYRHLNR
jgi:DNA invertase Pin-like site-specific DNA recombinase